MTNSNLEVKIRDLQKRLQAENEANRSITSSNDGPNPFAGSRPGSGRRPNILGDIGTPTRTRKHQIDIPGSNYPEQPKTDPSEIERKIKQIKNLTGILCISNKKYQIKKADLVYLSELGNGTYGHVVKMRHKPSGSVMAVKQMSCSENPEENKRIAMDLEVVLKSNDCDYIVKCLGCFIEGKDVWICMELMATCFDKLLQKLNSPVPEDILGKLTFATVNALHYLKETHRVIHRDVKPSNILIDEKGNIKLCDFGISGFLIDSRARTKTAGCAAYMAPERINPPNPRRPDYDIRADVWSLGITLVEIATGSFPYEGCTSDFEVLSRVLQDDPPSLPRSNFSPEFQDFVKSCLAKDYRQRPKYKKLLEHPFLRRYAGKYVDVAKWFAEATQARMDPHQHRNGSSYLDQGGSSTDIWNFDSKSRPISHPKTYYEGLRGVWNILKSPLFGRKKRNLSTTPPIPTNVQQIYSHPPQTMTNFHQIRVEHSRRVRRSNSVSPTRCYLDYFGDQACSDFKNLTLGTTRTNPAPSPEPPPRINKMVSPLLRRRMAYNNMPFNEIPSNTLISHFSSTRRYGMRIPPQPPPRRKNESSSLPCSPVPPHRVPLSPHSLWHHDVFNKS